MNQFTTETSRKALRTEGAPLVAVSPALPWRVVGAAVTGISHQRLGLPCQDVQSYRALPGGVLLAALADGAGSAPFSDRGARCAVDQALRSLSAVLEDGLPEDRENWRALFFSAFVDAREAVLQLAETDSSAGQDAVEGTGPDFQPNAARAYASTLTCVAAGGDFLVVGQVGDGVVVAQEEDGTLFTATWLQRGEYANETHFLTQEDVLDQVVIDFIEKPVQALAVMSDGLIRLALKLPSQEPHAPFFQPLFGFAGSVENEAEAAQQLEAFLSSERVNARTDDDKSLLLAVRSIDRPTPHANTTVEDGTTDSVTQASAENDTMMDTVAGSPDQQETANLFGPASSIDREGA